MAKTVLRRITLDQFQPLGLKALMLILIPWDDTTCNADFAMYYFLWTL